VYVNARGTKGKVKEIIKLAGNLGAIAILVSESHLFKEDISTKRWTWYPGKENLPVGNQTFPPRGMGILMDNRKCPSAAVTVVDEDSMWIRIAGKHRSLHLGLVYAPAAKHTNRRQRMYEDISGHIRDIPGSDLLVLGGDFNARMSANGDPTTLHCGRTLAKFANDNGLQIVNKRDDLCKGSFTRSEVQRERIVNTTVDYIMVPEPQIHGVRQLLIHEDSDLDSDHRPISITFNWSARDNNLDPNGPHWKWRTDALSADQWSAYEDASEAAMTRWHADSMSILASTAEEIPTQDAADLLWGCWRAYNHTAAITTIGRKKIFSTSKPWYDREVDELRTLTSKAKWCARKADSTAAAPEELKAKSREVYRTTRNAYRNILRSKKRRAQNQQFRIIERNQNTGNMFWKLVTRRFRKKTGNNVPKTAIDSEGNVVSNAAEVISV
jgi:hypothetical protein